MIRLIFLHSTSANLVLYKKPITKKILFNYLSDLEVPITNNAGKQDLIEKILTHWKDKYIPKDPYNRAQEPNVLPNTSKTLPIQQMSEEFVQWFFDKINKMELRPNDLWVDSTCSIRIIDCYNTINDSSFTGQEGVLRAFGDLRIQFDFLFNPNICDLGVQGKINRFGMVMVASCGTVHRSDKCIGVFEGGFGLVRDATISDSWKMKHLKMLIKSVERDTRPVLDQCESLSDILVLPNVDIVS